MSSDDGRDGAVVKAAFPLAHGRAMMSPRDPETDALATVRALGRGTRVEAQEIFQLIVKADERLKYATGALAQARTAQARGLLEQAVAEASAIGDDRLVDLARQRLEDLDRLA